MIENYLQDDVASTTAQAPVVTSAYGGRVPLRVKTIHAIGSSAETIIGTAFNAFNFFFYTNLLGVPGTLAGLAITIALIFDAVSDPLVGTLSDRWKSRLGRRHPFMFAAPIPVMICLFLIYSPPELETFGLFMWLTVLTVIMRTAMTLFHVPHLALGAELSADFTERTRVMSINTLLGGVGGIATAYLAYTYVFASTPEFENGMLNAEAYDGFAATAALIGGAIMLVSTVFTLNLVSKLPQPPQNLPRISTREFVKDVTTAMSNRNYLMLLIGYLLLSATIGTRATIDLHMNTYYWGLLPEDIRFFSLMGIPALIIGSIVTARLHNRFEKKPVLIVSLIALIIVASAPVLLRIAGLFPQNENDALLPSLLTFSFLSALCVVLLLISAMSALADIADEHELKTHRRQEGIFYSARSFFAKASSGLGHLLGGIAIDVIGFPAEAKPGEVDPEIVYNLGLVDGPISIIPAIIGVFFYLRYNLSRSRHTEIQNELAERHKQNLLETKTE